MLLCFTVIYILLNFYNLRVFRINKKMLTTEADSNINKDNIAISDSM